MVNFNTNKRKKVSRKKKRTPQQKEIRIRPKIGDHDKMVKLKQTRDFVENGDKVTVTMNFRGREMVHMEVAKKTMEEWAEELADIAKIEKPAKLEGRRMIMVISPK